MAADRCHCPPWDLLERPAIWRTWAMAMVRVEQSARSQRQRLAQLFTRSPRGGRLGR